MKPQFNVFFVSLPPFVCFFLLIFFALASLPCTFVPHRIGCESEQAYNLTVTTCQKCLKTGHSTSPPYESKQKLNILWE